MTDTRNLAALREHVTERLRELSVPGRWNSVESHPGRFSDGDLRKTLTDAPCARVAIDSVGGLATAGPGKWTAQVGFRIYVFARDGETDARDALALEFVEMTLQQIAATNWGDATRFRNVLPDTAGAINLFSDATDAAGVALWEISWQQNCVLTP